jgi:hypothetical protein
MRDEELNEIFRVFGHAAFYAYIFEAELAALAGTLRAMTYPYHSQAEMSQYDALLRSKRTAGQLITQELTALTRESSDWGTFLQEMTDVRNRLMHRFYEEQLPNLNSNSGRKFALKELKVIAMQLKRGGDTVKSLYLSLAREHLGFDDKRFREHADKIIKRWRDK